MDDSGKDKSFRVCGVMPVFSVGDIEAAITFYKTLGFGEMWRYPDGLTSGATHAGLCCDDVSLMLAQHSDESRPFDRACAYVFVREIDRCHAEFRSKLGDRVSDLVDSDYDMRDFNVTDPWGNQLDFGESTEDIATRKKSPPS